jgi:hypothetical protein
MKRIQQERGRRFAGSMQTAHMAVIETFPFVQKRARFLEEPFFFRTPVMIFKGFIACRRPHLFSCTTTKENTALIGCHLPKRHGFCSLFLILIFVSLRMLIPFA